MAKSAKSEPVYECDRCHDNGVVMVLTETDEEMPVGDKRAFDLEHGCIKPHTIRQCSCGESKRVAKLFRSSQIPDGYRDAGFKGFRVEDRPACVRDARDTAVDYFKKFDEIRSTGDNSIALLGPPGSGKTHLLMAVANGLMRRGISVLYFPWVEGLSELKQNFDGLAERVDTMKRVDVLFVDDLYKGRRSPTDFAREQIYGVVNFRYSNRLPMLVSSEFDFDALFEIDEGIARRVYQPSRSHRVVMGLTTEEREVGMELNFSLLE